MASALEGPGIVVGVDGSAASQAATDWAARDAATRNVPLTVVRASSGAGTWPQIPMPTGLGEWQRQRGREIRDDALRIAEEATRGTGFEQVSTEMYYSAPVPTLIDTSKSAELVVVGCRGYGAVGALAGALTGSVNAGLIHHAHCPVAIIHDDKPLTPYPPQAPVLVGIDGSPVSELATAISSDEASGRLANS